jgi:2'-5' RNA ligase
VIWEKSKRLFVALGLPQSCKEALLELDPHLTGLRWIPGEQLHLTLSFLGDVDPLAEERLQQALRAVRVPPFLLPLCGMGAFSSRRRVFKTRSFMQDSRRTLSLFIRILPLGALRTCLRKRFGGS